MNLYGIFVGTKFAMSRNRKDAINAVKSVGNGQVRSMPIPDAKYWDAPTFYTCSDPVYVLCAHQPEKPCTGMLVRVPGRSEFPLGGFGIIIHPAGGLRAMHEVQPVMFNKTSWINAGPTVKVPAYSVEATSEYIYWDVELEEGAGIRVARKSFWYPYKWMALQAAQHIFGATFVKEVRES